MSNDPTNVTLYALSKSNPALQNPAVARCCKAWKRIFRAEFEESEYFGRSMAAEAYRAALPPLTSRENCRDFIACVAQGMLLGAIAEKDGGKLLYAVQIALSASASRENASGKQEKSQKPTAATGNLLDFEAKKGQKS